uniref:Uncharacterized protein n=1 Tax=Arundo donax TaxID=35708 RepID=A0A0A9A9S3_ARUDO
MKGPTIKRKWDELRRKTICRSIFPFYSRSLIHDATYNMQSST